MPAVPRKIDKNDDGSFMVFFFLICFALFSTELDAQSQFLLPSRDGILYLESRLCLFVLSAEAGLTEGSCLAPGGVMPPAQSKARSCCSRTISSEGWSSGFLHGRSSAGESSEGPATLPLPHRPFCS